jgi:hypothetical protein
MGRSKDGMVGPKSQKRGRRTRGGMSRRIRSWFETVLIPVKDGLEIENQFLAERNWTWNCETQSLEYLRSRAVEYVDFGADLNFEMLLEEEADFADACREHDESHGELLSACRMLQQAIENLQQFKDLVSSRLTPEESEKAFGRMRKEGGVRYLAAYLVNNRKDVPQTHTTYDFWSRCSSDFVKTLGNTEIAPSHTKSLEAGERYLRSNAEGIRTMRGIIFRLSKEHDVPPVRAPSMQGDE